MLKFTQQFQYSTKMAIKSTAPRSAKQIAASIKAGLRMKAQKEWVDKNRRTGEAHIDAVRRYWAGKKK